MQRVTGLGGVFFKTDDPKALSEWYKTHLGLPVDEHGNVAFRWLHEDNPNEVGMTVWNAFPRDTKYFNPSSAPFMMNYLVADLHGLLEQLRAEGVEVDEKVEEASYGKFGWVMDPAGNRIELWEPPAT